MSACQETFGTKVRGMPEYAHLHKCEREDTHQAHRCFCGVQWWPMFGGVWESYPALDVHLPEETP